jgi:hypothetical protein
MTTARQLAKFQKALAAAAEAFEDVDVSTIKLPVESVRDLHREAASVIAYFDMLEKFREETCRNCNRLFAYAYYATTVKHCSIVCLKATLEGLGLIWNPDKPYEQRWGGRFVPAIVSADAYAIIQEQAPPVVKVEPEPVKAISDESQALILKLQELTGQKQPDYHS